MSDNQGNTKSFALLAIAQFLDYNYLRVLLHKQPQNFHTSFADTYRSRSRRDASHPLALDAELAQKEILREFGPRACILEEPCRVHASRPGSQRRPLGDGRAVVHAPWAEVLRYVELGYN